MAVDEFEPRQRAIASGKRHLEARRAMSDFFSGQLSPERLEGAKRLGEIRVISGSNGDIAVVIPARASE
jgi:hypothetical protein